MTDKGATIRWSLLVPALALVGLAASAVSAETRCVGADVPARLVLPDGSAHDPGRLRICMTRRYSPVAGLHQIHVEGVARGLFISRLQFSEGLPGDARPFLQFARARSGEWILEAYGMPSGSQMLVYRVQRQREQLVGERRVHRRPDAAAAEPVILVASAAY